MLTLFPPVHTHAAAVVTAADKEEGSHKAHVREECLRFLLKLEKLLKESLVLLSGEQVQTPPSAPRETHGEGGRGEGEHSITTIEHNLWMLLSSSSAHSLFLSSLSGTCYDGEGVALLLHCLSLIERVEVTMYTRQAYLEHALGAASDTHSGSGANNSHNGNSKECGLIFFSLQFHRNLCRLVEEIGVSALSLCPVADAATSTLPTVLVQYAQNRAKLVKAYTMLMDMNTHLSLSQMTVAAARSSPSEGGSGGGGGGDLGSSGRKASGRGTPRQPPSDGSGGGSGDAGGSLRAEAISWGARFLRPHYKAPPPSSSSSSSSRSDALDSSLHAEASALAGASGAGT
jgi:hypothetical protein